MSSGEAQGTRRPSPEALLEAATRETRRRLKVFVGAAPGVGKTYAMLQAARERQREGVDVVVGVVETHGRPETQALLQGLEVIPRQVVAYRGQTLEEMDLDATLTRAPQLVLVDELAHTNAAGSRHAKRFQDVEELLDAGIDVYTTVNIQHLESLNDVVAQITGVRVRETVPDRILDRADEVKLIDLSPEELIQRLREGKVYVPQQAERALANYFHPGNLTALRELALRETAEHVDEQMQAFMRAHAVAGVWPVAERVMVAVGGGPLSERLVRAARVIAERRNAPWIAVFVETAAFRQLPDMERDRITRVLRLAEQLGGEAVTIPGEDVAEELVRYAEERNVSELVLGRSPRSRWFGWLAPSTVNRVLARGGAIDVRVITGGKDEATVRRRATWAARAPSLAGCLLATGLVTLAALLARGLMAMVPLEDPAMLFLAAVLLTAVGAGLGASIFASVLGLLVYDFFFVEPYLTLTITKPQDILSLCVFLAVAILTSELTSRVRTQADAARRREKRTAALYAFGREIGGASAIDDLARVVVEHVGRLMSTAVGLLLPQAGRIVVRATRPSGTELSEAERATATWVWEHGEPAGRGTDTLPGGEWLHVPLNTVRGTVGVIALRAATPSMLPPDQRQLLEALAGQTALAIERARVDLVEAVIESIEDGLVVLDTHGVAVHVNEVACAILGFDREEAVGRRFAEMGTSHPHYLRLRAAVADFLEHPEREGAAVEMALFLRGRDHYYVLRPTPFRAADGAVAGLILVLQDVTYLRDQEARREQLTATLSHELRTPLTSLRMAHELLAARLSQPGEERELLETARQDALRLEDVAARLLDLSRSRAMSIALERQPVDLRALIPRVVKLFVLQARERGVALETSSVGGDLTIAGDPTKIGWALSNLIANALRYSPSGGTVRVATETKNGAVLVSVGDDGPGIPPGQRERIFERFAQGGDGDVGAAGLGLSIVRDIVQAHGGRIHLESQPGSGSRFTLELPMPGGLH